MGYVVHTDVIFRNCPLGIDGRNLLVDLVKTEMQDFDVVLGMDMLVKHHVTVDCKRKLISHTTPEGEKLEHKESNLQKVISIISTIQAFKMIRKWC